MSAPNAVEVQSASSADESSSCSLAPTKRKADDTIEEDGEDSQSSKRARTIEPLSEFTLTAMPADEDELYAHYVEQRITKTAVNEGSRSCVLETCYPPFWDDSVDARAVTHTVSDTRGPAKLYPFTLDPFQSQSIASLERGQSVLVSAHTSAGKTVVAEYAIAMALRDNQRVIYTSPIKALSNQKYRELFEEFRDVGLMTGDITINPSASCLVMTTEILRNMLYRGSEVVREVSTIIYDEIHYMRNKERGVVWEETIIMVPHSVKFVFLSATIPNANEFACWIAKLHHQPVNVVYTDYRPTPLQHYLFPTGGDGLYLVVDEKGQFREENFQKALAVMKEDDTSHAAGITGSNTASDGFDGKAKNNSKKRAKKGEGSDIFKIVKMCLPEHDTRVLTNAGFLFLSQIEARIAAGQPVLYACYDTASQSIVYRPGTIVLSAPPTRWVEFAQAGTRRMWAAGSDDYGSTVPCAGTDDAANHLTLRTTPEHRMFVQLGRPSGSATNIVYNMRKAGNVELPPHLMPAVELTPGFQCNCPTRHSDTCPHGWPAYRLYTAAAQGIGIPSDVMSVADTDAASPVVALGLTTVDELDAFLELYGYWLADGTMSYDHNSVRLSPKKVRDRVYLRQLLERLPLTEDVDWLSWECRVTWVVHIKAPHWFAYFDSEYGPKYQGSDNYDKDIEKIKSAKWLLPWVLTRLSKDQVRLVLEGVRQGDGWSAATSEPQAERGAAGGLVGVRAICTWSIRFREELMQACLHAGYSTYLTINTRAGVVRGYRTVPSDTFIYTPEEMKEISAEDPDVVWHPVRGNHDNWWVLYSESTSELLLAQDVHYDGAVVEARKKRPRGEGWVAVHSDGRVQRAKTQRALADDLDCLQSSVNQAHKKGGTFGGGWRPYTAAEYEEAKQPTTPETPTLSISSTSVDAAAGMYDAQRDGRVWCVQVQHTDNLIIAQRAHTNAVGVVTKVGRAMIIGNCLERAYQPVIVFSFSKRDCEHHAAAMAKIDFSDSEERKLIDTIFNNAIESLNDDDKKLPQVTNILPILRRGIGIHHSGLLPLLKEVIEILFQEGLLKCLFSTETFSMGLNMPAKTVVFTSIKKWDGSEFRIVTSGEYIQMSGRAGRRGLDERGIVIAMLEEAVEPTIAKSMLKGESDTLNSSFHLGYNMLLNLLRVEDQNPRKLMARSFLQFQSTKKTPMIQSQLEGIDREMAALRASMTDFEGVEEYWKLTQKLRTINAAMKTFWCQPQYVVPFLNSGRLVRVAHPTDADTVAGAAEYGWCVIKDYQKKAVSKKMKGKDNDLAFYEVIVLVYGQTNSVVVKGDRNNRGKSASAIKGIGSVLPAARSNAQGEWQLATISIADIDSLSSVRLSIPRDGLKDRQSFKSLGQTLDRALKEMKQSPPLLDYRDDMKVKEIDTIDKLVNDRTSAQSSIDSHSWSGNSDVHSQAERVVELAKYSDYQRLSSQFDSLITERQRSSGDTSMMETLNKMQSVLQKLGHTTSVSSVIDVKGRVAAEISTADELVASELMLNGSLNDLSVEVTVALCSCLCMNEKHDEDDVKSLRPELKSAYDLLTDTARMVGETMVDCQLDLTVADYLARFSPVLMEVCYQWCRGEKFAAVMKLTDVFEGTIIRCMRRLEELLRQFASAADAVGNESLAKKFTAGIALIKRDIVFAASLYL